MATIETNNRIKYFASTADKAPEGFVTPPVLALSGAEGNVNVLGSYTQVLAFYNAEPSPFPSGALVWGDSTRNLFELRPTGDYTVNPETDTNNNPNGIGQTDNWTNITLREMLLDAIDNKFPFLWNPVVAPNLVHPVSMFGSDGQLYNSVSGGNLEDDPINGNNANWILFLDPSTGLVTPGDVQPQFVSTTKNGWLKLDGDYESKALYPNLYTHLQDGTGLCIYGETADFFRKPDTRGRGLRGLDEGAGRDPAAAGFTVAGYSITNGDTFLDIPDTNLVEVGMSVDSPTPGFAASTVVTDLLYADASESSPSPAVGFVRVSISPNWTGATGSISINFHSRKDRLDGTAGDAGQLAPSVTDDAVGTVQEDGYKRHDHPHIHNYQGTSSGDAENGNNQLIRDTLQNLRTSSGNRDAGNNTETRMKNIAVIWIIKT